MKVNSSRSMMAEKSNNVNTCPLSNLEHHKVFDVDQNMGTHLTGSGTFFSFLMPLVERYHANNSINSINESLPPKFEKFDMQTSNACHKGFVVFDHTETKNTVICHPSWLNDCTCESSLGPEINQIGKCFLNEGKDFNQQIKEAMPSFHFSSALQPNLSRSISDDIVQDSTTMRTSLAFKSNRGKCDIGRYHNVQTKNESEISFSSGNGILNQFHEDTEEIDALLSSDEELNSTGHSPEDDASSNCLYEAEKNDGIRKRKFRIVPLEEEDDASVGLGKADLINKDTRNSNIWGLKRKVSLKSQLSRKDPSVNILEQVYMGMNDYSSSSGTFGESLDPTKRVKIKANIRLLKNVIPGGNDLDTETVLSRAVQYVKCLEQRLQALERGGS